MLQAAFSVWGRGWEGGAAGVGGEGAFGKIGKANASLALQTEFLCLPGFKTPNLNSCSIFILLSLNFLILFLFP